ncbi:MAG: helix-turn-helix domain-containing protein [Deltaproteobacteria bacterium]|nr:MAG: helix-turn-helix domain-containing protein [Deltaproteobacteria bacterium]
MGNPRLLSIPSAAEWLGIGQWSLREHIWAGRIPVVRPTPNGKMWLDRQDLERFIKDNKFTVT